MEGISNEACSLACHWELGKLVAFYDDNHISIDGDTKITFTEYVITRFQGLGWHTIWTKNGNTGYDDICASIEEKKCVEDKPTLIKVTTTIGFGSPNKENTYSVHGSAFGAKEVEATRQNLYWPFEPFHVPEDVKRKRPSIHALSRQKLPHLLGSSIKGVEKGGYIISDNSFGNNPDVILIGTGLDLEIAEKARIAHRNEGKVVRVVSFVCFQSTRK
ncbi:hypothetical protein KI387_023016, partial [Taxus chinensis]